MGFMARRARGVETGNRLVIQRSVFYNCKITTGATVDVQSYKGLMSLVAVSQTLGGAVTR